MKEENSFFGILMSSLISQHHSPQVGVHFCQVHIETECLLGNVSCLQGIESSLETGGRIIPWAEGNSTYHSKRVMMVVGTRITPSNPLKPADPTH